MTDFAFEIDRRPPFYIQTGSMFENPFGVPRDEIFQYILDNPPEVVAQVVFGKYVESSGLVFTGELVQNMVDASQQLVISNTYLDTAIADEAFDLYKRWREWGQWFATGVDFARQTDFTVIHTLDIRTLPAKTVYWRRLNRVPWETIYSEVGRARALFGPHILCDGTGPGGDVVMDALESRLYCVKHKRCVLSNNPQCVDPNGEVMECDPQFYLPLSCCDSFHFTGPTKKELIEHLRNCLSVGYNSVVSNNNFGWIRTPPIPQLTEEMTFYAWDDKDLETDTVFGLALAAWEGLESPIGDADVGSIHGS